MFVPHVMESNRGPCAQVENPKRKQVMTGNLYVGMVLRTFGKDKEDEHCVVQEIRPWDRTKPNYLVRLRPASPGEIAMFEVMTG